MEITFHGAAQTVTGSQHLLQINGHKLLLECGLYQGRRQEAFERNRNLPFEPREIDAVILSHAHIDHSGNLPQLFKIGYRGPVYATHATAHLANVMLMDSGHIQEADAAFVNKRNERRGEPLGEGPRGNSRVEPLYTQEDAALVAQYFHPLNYREVFEPVEGVRAQLVEAGHILGSAAVSLEIEENGGKPLRVWFSGDIGRRDLPLIRDPELPEKCDTLIMECTYGDKSHRDPEAAFEELRDAVGRTVGRGGKVIIPAFAVGRTQELVYGLQRLINSGDLPRVPVFVDSPLAVNVSDVFRAHGECFDSETREFVRSGKHRTVLGFDLLTYTRSVEESKALNDRKEPMVIISASGMAETGRILHHLRHNIEDARNMILIVSWQAPNTLGRRLAEREQYVKIFGEVFERKAEVATIGGLSAHAGQDYLAEYARAVSGSVKQIFLVHGELTPAMALSDKLVEARMERPFYPELGQSVEV